jgi:ParB/RepB/Spo0J family partition protein
VEYVELVSSIREHGVLQPILVRPGKEPGEYEVVDGFHRYSASKEAGLAEIPCLIRDFTDDEVLVYQIMCNSIRPETRSFEYARRLKILMESGLTLPQLSRKIKKSTKWIENNLHLNRLCEEAHKPVERGEIAMPAALALANLPSALQTKFLADAIAMPTREFCERAKAALRDFKAYLLRVQKEDREDGLARPRLRPVSAIKCESVNFKEAKQVLKVAEAKTPLQGWKLCLAWLFRLDPLSIERRKAKYKEPPSYLTTEEHRLMDRKMIRKLVTPQSRTGDHRNDK